MCSLGNYHTPSTFSSPHLSLSSFPCACHLSSLAEAYRPVLLDHTATAGGMSLITVALIFPSLVPSFHPVPFFFFFAFIGILGSCIIWGPALLLIFMWIAFVLQFIIWSFFPPHSFLYAVMAHFDYRLFSPLQSAQQSKVQNE